MLHRRAEEAGALLKERLATNKGRQVIVVAHYPTDYLKGASFGAWPNQERWLDHFSREDVRIVYFGAHRHSTENTSTLRTGPNPNWCVGGGGGWSCDESPGTPENQGVVVGEITSHGRVRNMRTINVPNSKCCFKSPRHFDGGGHPIYKPAEVQNPWDIG